MSEPYLDEETLIACAELIRQHDDMVVFSGVADFLEKFAVDLVKAKKERLELESERAAAAANKSSKAQHGRGAVTIHEREAVAVSTSRPHHMSATGMHGAMTSVNQEVRRSWVGVQDRISQRELDHMRGKDQAESVVRRTLERAVMSVIEALDVGVSFAVLPVVEKNMRTRSVDISVQALGKKLPETTHGMTGASGDYPPF